MKDTNTAYVPESKEEGTGLVIFMCTLLLLFFIAIIYVAVNSF
ncbi:hypothetical protein [Flaviaesturariibacter flavus]|nr:hypothetical protein [Flaviaesturariibacter flavus]